MSGSGLSQTGALILYSRTGIRKSRTGPHMFHSGLCLFLLSFGFRYIMLLVRIRIVRMIRCLDRFRGSGGFK